MPFVNFVSFLQDSYLYRAMSDYAANKRNSLPNIKKRGRLQKSSYEENKIIGPKNNVVNVLSDDDALKKGFDENQGLFLVLGALYRTSRLSWVHSFMFAVSCFLMLVGLGRMTVLISDDLSLLFETLHYITIIAGTFVILPPMMKNKFRFQKIFKIFGRNVYKYEMLDEETILKVEELRAKGNKEKKLLTKLFTVMLLGTFAGFSVLLPGMYVINGQFFESQRSEKVAVDNKL